MIKRIPIIRKITIGGVILWLLLNLIRTVMIFFISLLGIIPILNIHIWKQDEAMDIIDIARDNIWERCKSNFRIVKQTKVKVVEEILEKVK